MSLVSCERILSVHETEGLLGWSSGPLGRPAIRPMLLAAPRRHPTCRIIRPPSPCRSPCHRDVPATPSRLSGKGLAELLAVRGGTYVEVPAGILPEATKEYYEDPMLKVCYSIWK